MTIAFISCVKMKADRPMHAKDLYISPWFVMARRYAEQNADRWFILSAEYGLTSPDKLIRPYDKTLSAMSGLERASWADRVCRQIEGRDLRGDRAIVLAGENYRQGLISILTARFRYVAVPMAGLPLGRQLSWLKDSTRNPDRSRYKIV